MVLTEQYIIANNYGDVMSESFGDCEANYTSTQAAGIESLVQQAAAQGITYVVAAGDSGSAGCDDPNTEQTAAHGLSVNILASTPYTIAVGGTSSMKTDTTAHIGIRQIQLRRRSRQFPTFLRMCGMTVVGHAALLIYGRVGEEQARFSRSLRGKAV